MKILCLIKQIERLYPNVKVSLEETFTTVYDKENLLFSMVSPDKSGMEAYLSTFLNGMLCVQKLTSI